MEHSEIEEKLKDIFSETLKIERDRIHKDLKEEDVDSWDSLANLTLFMEIESRMGISFDIKDISKKFSFGEIEDLVKEKILNSHT